MDSIRDRTIKDMLGESASTLTLQKLRKLKDCVMMLDDEGRVTGLSRSMLSELGVSSEDGVIGALWPQIWPEASREAMQTAVERGRGGHITKYWSSYEHADGSISEWDIRLSPVIGAHDEVKSILAVSRKLAPT